VDIDVVESLDGHGLPSLKFIVDQRYKLTVGFQQFWKDALSKFLTQFSLIEIFINLVKT